MSFFGFSILDLKKTIHFTSLPFRWRPPCLIMRGYGVVVLWAWDILRAYMVRRGLYY